MNLPQFNELSARRVLLLDGATGSCLRSMGMPVGVSTELWALEHPDAILTLQRSYVEAGSDIIYAPTFSANRLGLSMYGLEDRLAEINAGLVSLSRKAAAGRALVAGDLTTTGKALEPKGDLTYQQLLDVYAEQIDILAHAGSDLLVAETMLSIDETMAAVEAAHSVCDLPIMCSMTLESDGQLLFGGSAVDAVESLQALGAASVGLNCSVGPDHLEAVVSSMKSVATVPLIVKPNAGMPVMDDRGVAHYSMTPDDFAASMKKLLWRGARLVGGCCGTSPEYIRALAGVLG